MEVHQGFHAIASISQVIGLVDGTLIPITNPSALDQAFICRKGFAAINVQVMVDNRGMFADVVAKLPDLCGPIQQLVKMQKEDFWAAHFFRRQRLPPKSLSFKSSHQPYNTAHIHTRNLLEHSIGRWKMCFRCLHKSAGGLRLKPEKCCAVAVVTAMIHNIAVSVDAALPEEEEEEGVHNRPELRDALHAAAVQMRQQFIHTISG
ncbi:hypothetical protein H4Q32_026434 [Labeo rohita]|uniref:DDE Tnp4 domain-containing protein n=1 Tax=Labeo rohita TaxID=84645 RepID=A0ABQ8MV82_LABRO|nr:hypothetical protein H4Q32_026434 [Labeo rohita]